MQKNKIDVVKAVCNVAAKKLVAISLAVTFSGVTVVSAQPGPGQASHTHDGGKTPHNRKDLLREHSSEIEFPVLEEISKLTLEIWEDFKRLVKEYLKKKEIIDNKHQQHQTITKEELSHLKQLESKVKKAARELTSLENTREILLSNIELRIYEDENGYNDLHGADIDDILEEYARIYGVNVEETKDENFYNGVTLNRMADEISKSRGTFNDIPDSLTASIEFYRIAFPTKDKDKASKLLEEDPDGTRQKLAEMHKLEQKQMEILMPSFTQEFIKQLPRDNPTKISLKDLYMKHFGKYERKAMKIINEGIQKASGKVRSQRRQLKKELRTDAQRDLNNILDAQRALMWNFEKGILSPLTAREILEAEFWTIAEKYAAIKSLTVDQAINKFYENPDLLSSAVEEILSCPEEIPNSIHRDKESFKYWWRNLLFLFAEETLLIYNLGHKLGVQEIISSIWWPYFFNNKNLKELYPKAKEDLSPTFLARLKLIQKTGSYPYPNLNLDLDSDLQLTDRVWKLMNQKELLTYQWNAQSSSKTLQPTLQVLQLIDPNPNQQRKRIQPYEEMRLNESSAPPILPPFVNPDFTQQPMDQVTQLFDPNPQPMVRVMQLFDSPLNPTIPLSYQSKPSYSFEKPKQMLQVIQLTNPNPNQQRKRIQPYEEMRLNESSAPPILPPFVNPDFTQQPMDQVTPLFDPNPRPMVQLMPPFDPNPRPMVQLMPLFDQQRTNEPSFETLRNLLKHHTLTFD